MRGKYMALDAGLRFCYGGKKAASFDQMTKTKFFCLFVLFAVTQMNSITMALRFTAIRESELIVNSYLALVLIDIIAFFLYRVGVCFKAYILTNIFVYFWQAIYLHVIFGGYVESCGVLVWLILGNIIALLFAKWSENIIAISFSISVCFVLYLLEEPIVAFNPTPYSRIAALSAQNAMGIAIVIFITLGIYIITGRKYSGITQKLLEEAESSRLRLEQLNAEYEFANDSLKEALKEARTAQSKLVHSEKMAAVGLLSSGIAHEISSPIAAVKAFSTFTQEALQGGEFKLVRLLRTMDWECFSAVMSTLEGITAEAARPMSTTEERAKKRAMAAALQEEGVHEPLNTAGRLSEIGVGDVSALRPLMPVLKGKDMDDFLYAAGGLSTILRAGSNTIAAADKIIGLVNALKNYSHYDEFGEKKMADIRAGIDVVLTLFQNQFKHGIQVTKVYGDIPKTFCCPDELNQVWTNIIQNAIHAMNGSGELCVKALVDEGGDILVSFKDTGCGIKQEDREKIFEEFFTTKPAGEGSGLGMSISRRIVENHGGTIDFDSSPDGTLFRVRLPVAGAV